MERCALGREAMDPGEYAAVLVGAEDRELSRSRFWVVAPDASPTLTVSKPTFAPGEEISVAWENAPAHMRDWIGIYPAGALDLYNGYLAFAYTGATVAGQYTFGADDLGEEMLPPGEYIAVLCADDGYAILAQVPFTVGP